MGIDRKSQPALLVGDWEVWPASNRLIREAREVVVTPKVMATLMLLCENAGQPVGHELMLERIWQGQVVTDNSLYQVVAQLRKALGDTATPRRYVERLSGKGYRLIAPVSALPAVAEAGRRKRRWLLPIALLAAGLLAGGYWMLPNWWPAIGKADSLSLRSPAAVEALAVSAFDLAAVASSAEHQFWAEGLTDTLLTRLARVPGLRVVATASSLWRDDQQATTTALRERHRVDAVVSGRIQVNGRQLRVTVRILTDDAAEPLWISVFDGSSDSLFELQDAIAHGLLTALRRSVGGEAHSAPDSVAFDHYLLGRFHWAKRTADDLSTAVSMFDRAIELDPGFALAYVGLCDSYQFLSLYADGTPEHAATQCQPLLDKALELAPDLGQAHASLGLLLRQRQDFNSAEQSLRRAVELAPNYAPAYMWYGVLKRHQGQTTEALELHRKAFELAPYSPNVNRNLAFSLLNLGQLDRARQIYLRALELEPNYVYKPFDQLEFFPLSVQRAQDLLRWQREHPALLARNPTNLITLAATLLALDRPQDAAHYLQRAESAAPRHPYLLLIQGLALSYAGDTQSALAKFEQRMMLDTERSGYAIPVVAMLTILDRKREAINLLRRHFDDHLQSDGKPLTRENHSVSLIVYLLLHTLGEQQQATPLGGRVRAYLDQHLDQHNPLHLAWLTTRPDVGRAQALLEDLLDGGWIPNINDSLWRPEHDPFWQRLAALDRRRLLQKLASNRRQALSIAADRAR